MIQANLYIFLLKIELVSSYPFGTETVLILLVKMLAERKKMLVGLIPFWTCLCLQD
jgi:hypothetical protein